MTKDRKNKIISFLLKVILPLMVICYLVFRLANQDLFVNLHVTNFLSKNNSPYLLIVLILSLVNWGIEAIKWRKIVSSYEPSTLFQSLQAVLAGLAISSLFPFRVGEYIGRLSFIKNNRIRISLLNMLSGLTQLFWTILFGMCVLFYNWDFAFKLLSLNLSKMITIAILGLLILVIIILFLIFQKNWLRLIKTSAKSLSMIKNGKLIYDLFWLSGLRYLVFILQFYFLFKILPHPFSFTLVFQVISLMFLLLTFLPINQIVELGATRSLLIIFIVELMFFKLDPQLELYITFIGLFIWIINIALPSLFGAYYMSKNKVIAK